MNHSTFDIEKIDSPIIVVAVHDEPYINPAVLELMNLGEHERFREEDPYTAYMADLSVSKVIVHTSRFLVDFNRTKELAIYKKPADAWGLKVWKGQFPVFLEEGLINYYSSFYAKMKELIEETIQQFGYFVILDIHSYNHRREAPHKTAPEKDNPEINIGTAHNDPKWQPLIQNFMDSLSQGQINGKAPDVRENIVFKGGGFSQWVNSHYKESGCVISIEFKKTFMDEWTGRASIQHIQDIKEALLGTIPLLKDELNRITDNQL